MVYIQALSLRHPICVILQVLSLVSFSAASESNNATENEAEKANITQSNIAMFVDNAEDLNINSNVSSQQEPVSTEVEQPGEGKEPKNETILPPPSTKTEELSSNETIPGISQANTESYQKKTAHILATKFMGSLFVAYILICIFLALKHGPMFTF